MIDLSDSDREALLKKFPNFYRMNPVARMQLAREFATAKAVPDHKKIERIRLESELAKTERLAAEALAAPPPRWRNGQLNQAHVLQHHADKIALLKRKLAALS